MPTTRTIQHAYAARPETLLALLTNAAYLRQRCAVEGDRNIRVQVEPQGELVSTTVARDRTLELPALVRGLIRPTNHTVEITLWRRHLDGFRGEYRVEAQGMPGTICGSFELASCAEGTRYQASFEVVARVPLIGRKLESLMATGFAAYLQHEAEQHAVALGEQYPSELRSEHAAPAHGR